MELDRVCDKHGVVKSQQRRGSRNGRDDVRFVCCACANEKRKIASKENHDQAKKRAWNHRNKEKRRAHKIVENAILTGKLKRDACERCGALQSQAHHDDYTKPLDVMWLCPAHHGERHRELRAMRRDA